MSSILPATAAVLAGLYVLAQVFQPKNPYGSNSPANTPYLRPWIPFVGSLGYALRPQKWMEEMHKKMGDVFTTTILGQNVTFVKGQKNVLRWAGATKKELNINAAYKKFAGNIVGPEVFGPGMTKTMYDGLAGSRLDALQGDLFVFVQKFIERKLGNSTSWSEPTEITPLLVEGTMQIIAWTLCGRHLAETSGTELGEQFHILENDLSVLGIVLNFPTPAIRRRERAKKRTFEIIQQEFRDRIAAIQQGKPTDDDFLSVVLGGGLDDETMARNDDEEIMKAVKRSMLIIYGLVWAAHTNTAASSVAAFCDLLQNPENIERILSQWSSSLKAETPPHLIFSEQTHLLRCLTETFRRRATGTLLRLAEQPFTISDPQSPSGAIVAPPGFILVAPSPYSLSPETYPSPLAFNPDRYDPSVFPYELDTVQSPSISPNAGLFGGFGFGKHACPGRLLAYRMIGNLVLAILEGWEMEMVSEEPTWQPLGSAGSERAQGPVTVRWRRKVAA